MTILVTGATGTVGRNVVEQLVKRGAEVRALVRDPAKVDFPAGVTAVKGDLLDVDSLRSAFSGVSTLFLLNAVVPDEFTQALIALNLAREAGVERLVYLSVIHSDVYVNVPHFAGKFGVERMIEAMGFAATILRPAYFMNNEHTIKDVVAGYGIYPMPIGDKGLAMIDARDIGEIAAIELVRRETSATPLPLVRINLVGPDTLTGAKAEQKRAYRHSGHPGGLSSMNYTEMLEKHPTRAVEKAVRGMLPRNSLGRQQLSKLKVYAGAEHPHAAQQPKTYTLDQVAQ